MDACAPKPGWHGELAARLAVRVAGTASPAERIRVGNRGTQWTRTDDAELQGYFDLMDEVCGRYAWDFRDDRLGDNVAYASCGQAVGAVVRATMDPDWNMWSCADEIACMEARPPWREVASSEDGDVDAISAPGDVWANDKHVLLYVGNEIAREVWPDTDANFFEAGFTQKIFPGLTCHVPTVDGWGAFRIFRATGEGTWRRPFIDLARWGMEKEES